jgi:hypothetical protein
MIEMREYGFHIRPCLDVYHPATLDDPPQSIGESKTFRSIRFLWSHTPGDCLYHHGIRRDFPVRFFAVQDLITPVNRGSKHE